MQQYHSKLILWGLALSCLSWLSAGCQPKPPSSSSSLPTSPQPQPTVSASVPVTANTASPVPSSQQTSAIPGSSPLSTTDTANSPPLSSEDKAIAQKVEKEVKEKMGGLAVQPVGKTFLSNILYNQQAAHLLNGSFSRDLEQLASDMPLEESEYRLQVITADANQSIVTAAAKTPGLPSYTGAVFAMKEKLSVSGICKTKIPSETPPSPPTLVGETVKCGSDSVSAGQ